MTLLLGQRLKLLRGTRTQDIIAKGIGISRARYSHYENGRSEPDNELLAKLAEYYNVSLDYLLGLTEQENYSDEVKDQVDKFLKEQNEDDQEIKDFMYLIMSEPPEERERLYRMIQAYLKKD